MQGTVTAADDGSPIAGAVLEVFAIRSRPLRADSLARDTTDAAGDYSLSFVSVRCRGGGTPGNIFVTHPDFQLENIGGFSDPHLTCTEELQTIDIQLVHLEAV
ncbi:MAG: hypothetical protein IIA27_11655 [Gemmatimonadetes bacterium]|nr:hypothetical protein [Gemmatimonadota bacterium]